MIRPYSPRDKDRLLHLLRLNTPRYFDPSEEGEYRQYLEERVEKYVVLEEKGEILAAGGINYLDGGRTARISWDMVHPDSQGRGLGKELTRYRIEQIKQQPQVAVIVVRTTQLVYTFYEKMGFALVKSEKDYWAPGFDLYYMEMRLK
jgi:[ribosomal protein S18]-alanine N-acetyltransferase